MCGRFTNKMTWEEIVRLYRAAIGATPRNLPAHYNICPTDAIETVVEREGRRELVPMRWGLVPYWWDKPLKELRASTFNARAETIETKPFFREPFKRRRCLIPMSGYYEWRHTPGGRQPYYFTPRHGAPAVTAAGLWDSWKNPENGERLRSCTMVVTAPNAFAGDVHDRMPALLAENDFEPWLSGAAGRELLRPAPDDLLARWPVSKRINSSKASDEDASLIAVEASAATPEELQAAKTMLVERI